MFPRITTRNVATTTLGIWGLALISWYYYNIQNASPLDNAHLKGSIKEHNNRSPQTPTMAPPYLASGTRKVLVWKERHPYTKLIMEAVNVVIGRNEDWKVHDGCLDEIINYASIPLAVNTLTLTTALLRYCAIVMLRANVKFKSWYQQPHVRRILSEVVEVVKHTINVYEL